MSTGKTRVQDEVRQNHADNLRRLALLARTSLNSVLVAQNLVAQELATMKIAILSTQSTTASIIFDVVNGSEESQKADVRRQTPNRILELDEDSDDSSQETIVKSCDQRQSRRSLGVSVEFQSSRWLRNLEISGTISSYWDENQSTYNISLKSKLPRLFGNRALTLEFKIRHYAMCWSSVSLMHSAIAVSPIVSEDSEIMKACRQGNESWVRNLFRDRRAGPNDLILGMESWEPNGPLSVRSLRHDCRMGC